MRLDSQHYFDAALERIEQARWLYRRGDSYALCMYTAGVAVECMLRAFRSKHNAMIDERHNLRLLFKDSGIMALMGESAAQEIETAINDVAILWANDYRYASEDRLRTHLRRVRLIVGIKGDHLKANSLRLLTAADQAVRIGEKLWHNSAQK